MKIKVCGMKYPENIEHLALLKPDFIGFIFYEKSKRFIGDSLQINNLPIHKDIQKVGVFVNATHEYIIQNYKKHNLSLVQLHGNETPEFCAHLFEQNIKVSKAFQLDEDFDFHTVTNYKDVCTYYLFDTKTKHYGGSGRKFDWDILSAYNNEKPFFLSGGIDIDDVKNIRQLNNLNIFSIDINSRFEIEPGLKDIGKIGVFMEELRLK